MKSRGTRFNIPFSIVVSALFFASGAKILSGTSLALAASGGQTVQSNTICTPSEEDAELLRLLQGKEKILNDREKSLGERSAEIEQAEKILSDRMSTLAAAENRLSGMLTLADEGAENDIGKLILVYENMRPKDAAPLFEKMTPSFAAGFLERMKPEISAAILAKMNPEVAYSISAIFVGKNANLTVN